jgi:hypothetical protein
MKLYIAIFAIMIGLSMANNDGTVESADLAMNVEPLQQQGEPAARMGVRQLVRFFEV